MDTTETLNQTFAALSHPVRREMLQVLAEKDATVKELAEPFAMSLPAVSKHIKVLERAGLITQGQNAQFRPCSLNPTPLKEIATWAEHYRPIWEARFDRMEAYINDLTENEDAR